jgi:polar amino acid transport system substrate-binding protein
VSGMRRARRLSAAGVVFVSSGNCTNVDVPESLPDRETTTATSEPAAPEQEDAPAEGDEACLESLRPDGPASTDVAADSYMEEIQQRDPPVLRVGVDVGTPQFSSIDPQTGEPEGFDVDIALEVAAALFGDRAVVEDAVELVGITARERTDALLDGRVDLVVHNFTITCDRWDEIAFSTEYFTAYQRILVPRGNNAESLEDLVDARVCATERSTAIERIDAMDEPRPLPVTVGERAECLMMLQQGHVDALATDDAILVGMIAQDPNLRLGDETFSVESYGIGLPPGRPEWVRYVNAVLEDVRDTGRWQTLYEDWLADLLGDIEEHGVNPEPPEPEYRD